ncbi:tetratricopeptide repeat protein [Ferruginibacter yonginensis]|uniref:histidine kinase n=1 Tax=Ferruginibacter yonginensis TaxID=1310416 RepID=A0ABV8QS71_9BACT
MKLILSILLVINMQLLFAQTNDVTVLNNLLHNIDIAKNDTLKARAYLAVIKFFKERNTDQAIYYCQKGMAHVTQMKWQKGIAVFNLNFGNIYSDIGQFKQALQYQKSALQILQQLKDTFNIHAALNDIGVVYQHQTILDTALQYFLKSLDVAKAMNNDDKIALAYNNIGLVYSDQLNHNLALQNHFAALKIRQQQNDPDLLAACYATIGGEYVTMNDTTNGLFYLKKAIVLFDSTANERGLASAYTNYSILLKDYRLNLNYKLKAQAIWDKINPENPISISNIGNIGLLYLDVARYDTLQKVKRDAILPSSKNELLQKAQMYLERCVNLSKQTNNISNLSVFLGNLSELQEAKGDYKSALENFRLFYHLNDSLYSQDAKNKLAQITVQKDIDLRNKEIALNKLTIANQQKIRWTLVGGLLLLAIIVALLVYQTNNRKKHNQKLLQLNTELAEANKLKAKFFAIISHDLRSPIANLMNFLALQKREPGLLSQQQIEQREQKITQAAQSLLDNMEALLLWSKGQMEQFKPNKKAMTVAPIFQYIASSFDTVTTVNFQFTGNDSLPIFSDENYLKTIMYNLTSNAVKALVQIPNAQIVWHVFKQNNKTVLSITDNGKGLQHEWVEAMRNEATMVNSKTGFGFHLIKDLAKAIDCTITVTSAINKGTTFTLSLS